MSRTRKRHSTIHEDEESSSSGGEAPRPQDFRARMREGDEEDSEEDSEEYDEEDDEEGDEVDEEEEKAGYLVELARLSAQGVRLTRQYGPEDSLQDIKAELSRQMSSIQLSNGVKFCRDALQLALTGIEMANNKLGPFLQLDGWSAAA